MEAKSPAMAQDTEAFASLLKAMDRMERRLEQLELTVCTMEPWLTNMQTQVKIVNQLQAKSDELTMTIRRRIHAIELAIHALTHMPYTQHPQYYQHHHQQQQQQQQQDRFGAQSFDSLCHTRVDAQNGKYPGMSQFRVSLPMPNIVLPRMPAMASSSEPPTSLLTPNAPPENPQSAELMNVG
jgi:hypothetical protein